MKQIALVLIIMGLGQNLLVADSDLVVDPSEGLGYIVRIHEANFSYQLELLGSSTQPGVQILLEGTDGQLLMDTSRITSVPDSLLGRFGQSFSQNDLKLRSGILVSDGNIPFVLIELQSSSQSPKTLSLSALFDIPERDQFPEVYRGSEKLESEAIMNSIKGSNFSVISENKSGVQIPVAVSGAFTYPESIVFSNFKRLQLGIKSQPVQEGRNLSFLPYSVLDRGISIRFAEAIVLPNTKAYFLIPLLPSGTSYQAIQSGLEQFVKSFIASLPLDVKKVEPNKRTKTLARINEIIGILNQAYNKNTIEIVERERLLDELQNLMQSLKE